MKELLSNLKDLSNECESVSEKNHDLEVSLINAKECVQKLMNAFGDKMKFYCIANRYGREPGFLEKEYHYFKDSDGKYIKGTFILKDVINENDYLAILYYLTKEGNILQIKETNCYDNWNEAKKRTIINNDYLLNSVWDQYKYDNISYITIVDVIKAIEDNLKDRINTIKKRNDVLSDTLETIKKINEVLDNE